MQVALGCAAQRVAFIHQMVGSEARSELREATAARGHSRCWNTGMGSACVLSENALG